MNPFPGESFSGINRDDFSSNRWINLLLTLFAQDSVFFLEFGLRLKRRLDPVSFFSQAFRQVLDSFLAKGPLYHTVLNCLLVAPCIKAL